MTVFGIDIGDVLVDLAVPRTDAGVLAQAVVAIVVLAAAGFVVRGDRELRTFVIGVATMTAAWFALRAVH